MYWLILRGLYAEWLREYREDQPSNRQLQEVFVGLSRKEQDQLMRLPTTESQRQLRVHYFRKNQPGDGMNMLQRIYRLAGRILTRRGSRPGDGFSLCGVDHTAHHSGTRRVRSRPL